MRAHWEQWVSALSNLWFSVSTSLFSFGCIGLSCDLNSLMDLKDTDFQFVQFFSYSDKGNDDFQALYMSDWNP